MKDMSVTPTDEMHRLRALYNYEILDTEFEKDFDDLALLAAQVCEVPIAYISFIDAERQWMKAKVGLDVIENERDMTICTFTILQDQLLMVEDTLQDDRFADNPFVVGEPHIRFYAGMPLVSPEGHKIGTVCIVDCEPRRLADNQQFALEIIATQTMKLLERKLKIKKAEIQKREIIRLEEQKNQALSLILKEVSKPLDILEKALLFFLQGNTQGEDFKSTFIETGNAIYQTQYLLTNMAYWTKMQLNPDTLGTDSVELKHLFHQEHYAFEKIARDKKIKLVNDIPPQLILYTHRDTLKLIIRNLLLNAYTRQISGKLFLKYEAEELKANLQIIDNGPQLTTQESTYLFSEGEEIKQLPDNYGINLVMAQELANQIGAKIFCQTNDQAGMTFGLEILLYKTG